MQLTSEQRIFVVTNYLWAINFKDAKHLFEQRFRDRVSSTKMTFWKNVKRYKTDESGLNLNKGRSGRIGEQNVHGKT